MPKVKALEQTETPESSKIKGGWDVISLNIVSYLVCGIVAVVCLVPFIMTVSASFSSEEAIMANGFSLLPQDISFSAYKTVFRDPMVVFRAYGTTICLTILGTFLGLCLQTMTAYVLSRRTFEWRHKFSFFFYFTTLFNGGLVPYYILISDTLGLRDNYLALLLPLLFSVYNLLIMKSYIMGIPESLIDAAKIDGCGEFRTLVQIVVPLIKPALATVGLFIALAYWNDWYNAMLYIKDTVKYPLQYFLYQQVNNIEAYKKLIANGAVSSAVVSSVSLPTQTLKMALTIVVTGPIVLAYPFVQKYFVQGVTIGAASSTTTVAEDGTIDTSTHVDLKMYLLGDRSPDFDEVYGKINEILEEKLNCSLTVDFLSWGEHDTKYSLLFSGGEDFDLIFTASSWGHYEQTVALGGFAPLSEEFVQTYAPDIWKTVPALGWEQAKVGGVAYMVPNFTNEFWSNPEVYDLAMLGIEGKHWEAVGDDQYKVLDESNFDSTNVSTQFAAVEANIDTYYNPLTNGLVDDVDASIAEFKQALEVAGMQDVMDEMNRQIEEYVAAK